MKKNTLSNYNNLSKYRNTLMGIAIILVLIYHTNFPFLPNIVTTMKKHIYFSVDIFFLVSGIGLYYSLSKNSNILSFYQKRLFRIFPTYIPIAILSSIIIILHYHYDIKLLFFNCFTLGYFFNMPGAFNWYMSALVLFYFISPFYFKIFSKTKQKELFTFISVIFCILLCFSLKYFHCNHLIIITARLPIFLCGFLYGYYIKNNITISTLAKYLYVIFFIAGTSILIYSFQHFDASTLWEYGLYWLPYILIVPGLCLLLTVILEYFEIRFHFNYSILNYLGSITLELYLINVGFLDFLRPLRKILVFDRFLIIYHLIYFFINIAGAILYHKLLNLFLNKYVYKKS